MDPATWGPHLWIGIHYIALGYPAAPSTTDKMNYKYFFENLDKVLPCGKCADHYKENLKHTPIDKYLDSPTKLFEWTVAMHNAVNMLLGKSTMTLQDAIAAYPTKLIEPFVCSPASQRHTDHSITFVIVFLLFALAVVGCVAFRDKLLFKKG